MIKKSIQILLLLVLFTLVCAATVQENMVVEKNDILVLKESGKPYTGTVKGHWNDLPFEKEYKNGFPHGRHIMWWENGQVRMLRHFIDGKATGKHTFWDKKGLPETETEFLDGKLHGYRTQWIGGVKERQIEYKNDVRDGCATYWNNEGNKYLMFTFKKGKQDGPTISWYPNGAKESELIFENGVLKSEKKWDLDGNPINIIKSVYDIVEPIEVLEGTFFLDGGSLGILIQDANRNQIEVTLDRSGVLNGIPPEKHKFGVGTMGPADSTHWLPISGKEENLLIKIFRNYLKNTPKDTKNRGHIEDMLEKRKISY